jgi:hypothetical protein
VAHDISQVLIAQQVLASAFVFMEAQHSRSLITNPSTSSKAISVCLKSWRASALASSVRALETLLELLP